MRIGQDATVNHDCGTGWQLNELFNDSTTYVCEQFQFPVR